MATITRQGAVDRIIEAVNEARADDLAEYHNELFPRQPIREDAVQADSSAVVKKVLAHIGRGLEIEEILDLWNVIFPKHRGVWFDEEEGLLYYEEKLDRVSQLD